MNESCGSQMAGARLRTASLAWIALVLLAGSWFYNGADMNQISRYDTIFSFVEPGTPDTGSFRINRIITAGGGPNTIDWANNPAHDRNYYSNKAPGPMLLGIPVYWALYHGERLAGLRPESPRVTVWNCYLLNLILTVLPLALSAAYFFRILEGFAPAARWWPTVLTALLYFGTLLWPYATQLWGHATAAAFIVIALWFQTRQTQRGSAWSGFFIGWAVLFDYGAGITLVSFPVWLALERRWRALPAFLVGGLLPLALFGTYHTICFGGPLSLASLYNNPGFSTPGAVAGQFALSHWRDAFWGLTFSPFRGLWYHMPFLVLTLPGLLAVRRLGRPRLNLAAICLLNMTGYFLMNLTFMQWHGGACTGPRYQIPALPFHVLFLACAATALPRQGNRVEIAVKFSAAVLGVLSIANMFMLCSISPMSGVPEFTETPFYRELWQAPLKYYYPAFAMDILQPNELVPLRLEPVEPEDPEGRTFILGQFLGLKGKQTTYPLLILLACGGLMAAIVGERRKIVAHAPHTK